MEFYYVCILCQVNVSRTIYTKDHKKLINKLTKARLAANLTQEEAGHKLKRTQSYISKLESGQRRVDTVQLNKLAKIYGKRIEDFV